MVSYASPLMAPWYWTLWMVNTVFTKFRRTSEFWYTGTSALCQSLAWMICGSNSMSSSASNTALEKKANRSPSSKYPYRPPGLLK